MFINIVADKSDYASSTISLAKSSASLHKESTTNTHVSLNTENKYEETVTSRDKHLVVFIISLNTIVMLIVCCIIGICLYCKRKWIRQKVFEDKEGNVFNRDRLQTNRQHFQESSQSLHRTQNRDIEMTEKSLTGNSSFFLQQRPYQHEYRNEIDQYLAPETIEPEQEYHQYSTVV